MSGRWTFSVELTVGDVRGNHVLRKRLRSSAAKGGEEKKAPASKVRHVAWTPEKRARYRLVRGAVPVDDIEGAFSDGVLREEHLSHWKHEDPHVLRTDKTEPMWMAAFRVTDPDRYVRPQQKHLKAIYRSCDRRDSGRAWDTMDDGTPYWTDLYAIRVRSEQESKRRYQQKRKRRQRNVKENRKRKRAEPTDESEDD